MIRLTENKIAVQAILDPDKTEGTATLSPKELEYLGLTEQPKGNVQLTIPEDAKERCDQGIVKYVGPQVKHIKVGDYVLFGGYTGTTVMLEGEGLMILLREDFVTAILDAPDTDVPGLYFRGPDGYFTATYEIAMEIMADAFRNSDFRKSTRIKNKADSREGITD